MKKLKLENFLIYFTLITEIIFLLFQAFNQKIDGDENEHLYGAYMIFQGYIPYLDFFEHHNPLLWYITAPLYIFFENDINIYYIVRFITFILIMLIAYYTYKISKLLTLPTLYSLLSVCFYLSFDITKEAGIQFRPDVPMALFIIIGIYYLLHALQHNQLKNLIISFFCLFISYSFLQKAIAFILPISFYIIYLIIKKKITLKNIIYACILPLIFTILYALYLYQTNSLTLHYIYNYKFNIINTRDFEYFKNKSFLLYRSPTIIFCFLTTFFVFIKEIKKKSQIFFFAFYTIICFFVLIHIVYASEKQYVLPILPFFSICIAFALQTIKSKEIYKTLFLITFLICQIFFDYQIKRENTLPFSLFIKLNTFIVQNTSKNDEVMILTSVTGIKKQAEGHYYFALQYVTDSAHKLVPEIPYPSKKDILIKKKPKIFCDYFDMDKESSDFIKQNYTPHQINVLTFWVRKDPPRLLHNITSN